MPRELKHRCHKNPFQILYTKAQLCSRKQNRWHWHQGLAEHGNKHTATCYSTTLPQDTIKKDPLKKTSFSTASGEVAEVKQPSSNKASPEHGVYLSSICEFTQTTKDLWSQLELRAPQQYTKSVPHSPLSPLLRSSCFSTAFVQLCTLRFNRPVISLTQCQVKRQQLKQHRTQESSHWHLLVCPPVQAASFPSNLLFFRQMLSVQQILKSWPALSSASRPDLRAVWS